MNWTVMTTIITITTMMMWQGGQEGGELRSAIPLPTSNHLAPSPSVMAITLLPMGRKRRKLNDIDPSVTMPDDEDVETLHPHLSRALGWQEDEFDISNPSVVKSMQALLTELTIFLLLIMSCLK
jgi:hypothetical protein